MCIFSFSLCNYINNLSIKIHYINYDKHNVSTYLLLDIDINFNCSDNCE